PNTTAANAERAALPVIALAPASNAVRAHTVLRLNSDAAVAARARPWRRRAVSSVIAQRGELALGVIGEVVDVGVRDRLIARRGHQQIDEALRRRPEQQVGPLGGGTRGLPQGLLGQRVKLGVEWPPGRELRDDPLAQDPRRARRDVGALRA